MSKITWIRTPPEEIRGGIGDALTDGFDEALSLGQGMAQVVRDPPASSAR